jgi:hypothetical protein
MTVICDHLGKSEYCRTCKHAKEHTPYIYALPSTTDCRDKSKCIIIEKVCSCKDGTIIKQQSLF